MGSNREKFNIAIVILENYHFFKGYQKLFRILMVAIIFWPTLHLLYSLPNQNMH